MPNFEIRHDVTHGWLSALLQVTLQRTFCHDSMYNTNVLGLNSPEIRNDIMSNLDVGQSVVLLCQHYPTQLYLRVYEKRSCQISQGINLIIF